MGRNPATLGLVDRDARRARPRVSRTRRCGARSRAGARSWSRTATASGPEACQSPIWDTGLAVLALRASRRRARSSAAAQGRRVAARRGGHGQGRLGDPPTRPRAGWLGVRVRERPLPGCRRHSGRRARAARARDGREAVRRGLDWIEGMQSANGGWGAFDADNSSYWLYKLPVLRLRLRDRPAERGRLRARARGARHRRRATPIRSRRGVEYLRPRAAVGRLLVGPLGRQPRVRHRRGPARSGGLRFRARASGDDARQWTGWTRSSTAGAASARTSAPTTRPRCAAAESTTASQTAWALLGYVAAGESQRASARRAADYLCAEQEANGDWSEEHYTGTGFPTDFMIRYHLYRLHFPLMALGRLEKGSTHEVSAALDRPDRQVRRHPEAQGRALPARPDARADAGVQPRLHRLREDPRVRVEQGAAVRRRVHRRGRPVPGAGRARSAAASP